MKKQPHIILCILLDVAGYLTYAIPGFGEFADVVWAPISAYIFHRMFGGRLGLIGGIFNFIEEALPGTDFIPSFTIAWLWLYANKKKKTPVNSIYTI